TTRVERKIDAASRRLHARHSFQPFFQLPEKFHAPLIIFVFRTLQRQVGDKDVVRIEARANLLETEEALDEQPSANQQHERKGDLSDQQEAARAGAAMTFAAASAFFQCAGDVELRGLKRGNDSEENAGKRRDAESEHQDAIID